MSACDDGSEPELIWCKNSLLFLISIILYFYELDALQAGFCWFVQQLSRRPSLNSVLLRHLAGSLFQRHSFVSLRLMASSPGKLKKQTSNEVMVPDRTSRCRLSRASLLRCVDKAKELTDSILFLTRKGTTFKAPLCKSESWGIKV